jgi:hypothetical protein
MDSYKSPWFSPPDGDKKYRPFFLFFGRFIHRFLPSSSHEWKHLEFYTSVNSVEVGHHLNGIISYDMRAVGKAEIKEIAFSTQALLLQCRNCRKKLRVDNTQTKAKIFCPKVQTRHGRTPQLSYPKNKEIFDYSGLSCKKYKKSKTQNRIRI